MADRMTDYGNGDRLHQLLADFRRRREAEAAERGMTLAELDAHEEAERQRVLEAKERREEARARARWIRTWTDYLPMDACARLYDGQSQSTDAVRHVRGWLKTETPCLILCGGVGTGKTYAGALLCRERWGEFVCAQHLARRIDPWKHERDSGAEPLDLAAPIVVLDDLGAEQDDARSQAALFAVINSRNASDRRTLITTNLTIPQIRPRYGDRIADRLNAMAKAVVLKGASMRKQEAGL